MGDKSFLLGGIVFFFTIFLTGVVFATVVVTRTDLSTNNFNFNEDTAGLYNVTVNNTAESLAVSQVNNITQINITFPSSFVFLHNSTNGTDSVAEFSISGTRVTWVNATAGVLNASVVGVLKKFWMNATALTPGVYNITIMATNWSNTYNRNITVYVNDTTVPFVVADNITLVNRVNTSDTIILNVSVGDNSFVNSVRFNISNSSGDVVIVTGTNPVDNYWNATLTTNNYADGVYNLTILANDTYGNGNLNNSAMIEVIIDNTNPSVSASCTPDSVSLGDVVTCGCSASDTTTAVNSTSSGQTITTTQTGQFTFGCSATDMAGNTGVGSDTYLVGSSGGGTSGSSGGSSSGTTTWSRTIDQSDTDLAESSGPVTQQLGVKERVSLILNGEAHHVGVVSLSATSAVVEVASTPRRATLNVGQSERFELDGDAYYDMQVTLQSLQGSKATVVTRAIHESLESTSGETGSTTGEETTTDQVDSPVEKKGFVWIVAVIIVVGVAFVFFVVWRKKN